MSDPAECAPEPAARTPAGLRDAQVREWIAADPDPGDRAELQVLLDAGDETELAGRFAGPLTFGTAGLRGPLRAGPNGMNVAVVRRTAAGLAAYLRATCADSPSVIIGYDARHRSARFAAESARVMAGAGLRVALLPGRLPTPVLAYAVRARGTDAGVMVTASHNPPQDNGYKVYLASGGGAQLVPPADAQIEAAIAAAPAADALPESGAYETLGPEVEAAYIDAIVGLSRTPERAIQVAYTPLHGVGGRTLLAAFAQAGFPQPAVVAKQAEPDPDFPTVAFPNPEESGATDLLLQLAANTGADIAIANDPDADRCAVATSGRLLTGDELGLLLADHVLSHGAAGRAVATTIVSSSALAALATARGAVCRTTLTGFKWLARAGGAELTFAYEEALGYAVGLDVVRDKDGISAALAVAELAAALKATGRTLRDRLDELAVEIGLYATRTLSVRLCDPKAGDPKVGDRVVELLGVASLAGRRVRRSQDLMHPTGGLPPTEGVRLELDGARIVVRPSGTEPKLKAYLEVVIPPSVIAADLTAARIHAAADLDALSAELQPLLGWPLLGLPTR